MVAPWRGLAIKRRESAAATAKQSRELAFAVGEAGANFASKFESAAAIPPSAKESEGSRAEAALSPAGRCAQSAGESAAAISPSAKESEGSRTVSVRSVQSVFINHGLFGLNGYVN